MASMKIKKGDMVKVIAGRDKDKEGKVIAVNSAKKNVTVLLDDNRTLVVPWEEVVEKDDE